VHEASNLHGVAEAHEHDEEGGSWCEPTPTANTAMAMAITTRMGTCSVRTEPMTRLYYIIQSINQSSTVGPNCRILNWILAAKRREY
jgi:hypothetical protein